MCAPPLRPAAQRGGERARRPAHRPRSHDMRHRRHAILVRHCRAISSNVAWYPHVCRRSAAAPPMRSSGSVARIAAARRIEFRARHDMHQRPPRPGHECARAARRRPSRSPRQSVTISTRAGAPTNALASDADPPALSSPACARSRQRRPPRARCEAGESSRAAATGGRRDPRRRAPRRRTRRSISLPRAIGPPRRRGSRSVPSRKSASTRTHRSPSSVPSTARSGASRMNARSLRASNFQSSRRGSSPWRYGRYSANSLATPRVRARWAPGAPPSTRAARATLRRAPTPAARRTGRPPVALKPEVAARRRNAREQILHDALGRSRLRLRPRNSAARDAEERDELRAGYPPARRSRRPREQRRRLGAENQRLSRARTRAPSHVFAHEFGCRRRIRSRRPRERGRIVEARAPPPATSRASRCRARASSRR